MWPLVSRENHKLIFNTVSSALNKSYCKAPSFFPKFQNSCRFKFIRSEIFPLAPSLVRWFMPPRLRASGSSTPKVFRQKIYYTAGDNKTTYCRKE